MLPCRLVEIFPTVFPAPKCLLWNWWVYEALWALARPNHTTTTLCFMGSESKFAFDQHAQACFADVLIK